MLTVKTLLNRAPELKRIVTEKNDSSAESVGELKPWALAFMPGPAAFLGQG
jgi:hypothetical protein